MNISRNGHIYHIHYDNLSFHSFLKPIFTNGCNACLTSKRNIFIRLWNRARSWYWWRLLFIPLARRYCAHVSNHYLRFIFSRWLHSESLVLLFIEFVEANFEVARICRKLFFTLCRAWVLSSRLFSFLSLITQQTHLILFAHLNIY